MKKHLLLLVGLIISTCVLAQVPHGISHQALMRDAENNLIVESSIGLQVSIIRGAHDGVAVYVETHSVMTNHQGLITYVIGEGTAVVGLFEEIDWAAGPYWLKTEADPTGGTDYSISGVTKFLSVPYALFALSFPGLEELLSRIETLEEALDIEGPEFSCGDDITFTYRGQEATYGTIERGGLCWMDRNLGASRVPVSMTDSQGYGDLFQWGRLDDGHQDRTSSIIPGPISQDIPGHSSFITVDTEPYDWTSPPNDDLWQEDGSGINNPCPPGWRLPTGAELNAERQSWSPNNSAGAYASALKWPVGGDRRRTNGAIDNLGHRGYVWSASVSGFNAIVVDFTTGNTFSYSRNRASGLSVRCVSEVSGEPNLYNLNLEVNPENAGNATGAGEYQEGEAVEISATAEDGWAFVEWTGDTEHLDDPNSADAIVAMPADNVTLRANFQVSDEPEPGTVTNIDSNVY